MNKENLIVRLKVNRDYAKQQVMQSINTLRNILDRVEQGIKNNDVREDDGLQGNEWRLYKELSNLERLNDFIKELEKMDD